MSNLTGRTTIVVGAIYPFRYEWEFSQPIAVTHECRSVEKTIRITEAESLCGEEHVRRYRETNGEVGHNWRVAGAGGLDARAKRIRPGA